MKRIPERISDAWEPLKESITVQVFSAVTAAEVLGLIFGVHKKLDALHGWPSWAPTLNLVIYGTLALFLARAMFLLAEKNGELSRKLTAASSTKESYNDVVATLHDIIHATRDSLLADNGFVQF